LSGSVVAARPSPGTPRPYEFPAAERARLDNGLTVIVAPMPGRPLVSATLVFRAGAADEPPDMGGATVLAARALTEGTERYDAIGLVEAAERLGATLHAEAGWDALSAGVDVPASRLVPALELLAEVVAHPTFPAREVERLRDERLNDILQARAEPRRRADEAFAAAIYAPDSPYNRPAGGTRETVERLDPEALRSVYRRTVDPARLTLVVAGDVDARATADTAEELFGSWTALVEAGPAAAIVDRPAPAGRHVRLIHRPGAVQSEVRLGHVGVPRRIVDFHAVSVMATILGGLFNSRLNRKLREEKGYTYGAGAAFDLRRAAGPFVARSAVRTEVTVPAVSDMLAELVRIREQPVSDAELAAGRDFLVGVFPLRFETPGPVAGALSGLVVHDLPDDELARYRRAIESVTADDVLAAAQARIRPDRFAIVVVGDGDAIVRDLEAANFGPLAIEREEGPIAEAPAEDEEPGPVDAGDGAPVDALEVGAD
jgi:zinc protease